MARCAIPKVAPGVFSPVRAAVGDALRACGALSGLPDAAWEPEVTLGGGRAPLQTSAPLQLARHARRPPRDLAAELVAALGSSSSSVVASGEVSGPGFVNLQPHRDWLGAAALAAAADSPPPQQGSGQRVLADFGSPNYGKELHVGHLRSAVIGDALSRLLEFRGHDVERVSHIGDFGTAMCTSLAALEEDPSLPAETATDLSRLYEGAKQRLSDSPDFRARVQETVLRLQRGDDEALQALWTRVCDASRRHVEGVNARLGVAVQERPESFYRDLVPAAVARLEAAGVTEPGDGGALLVRLADDDAMVVRKADGGFLYSSTDFAALAERADRGLEKIVYLTDEGQRLHFQQLFAVGAQAGLYDPVRTSLHHAWFGTVKGADGRRLKSREGRPMPLEQLLDETVAEVARRSPARDAAFHERLAMGAVRYAELSHHRERSYRFVLDDMLALKGNTVVYLQYACARARGLREKHGLAGARELAPGGEWTPQEAQLLLQVALFPDVLDEAERLLAPSALCEYLFPLAQQFHRFYEAEPVVGNEHRMAVCDAADAILRRGLGLLGIDVEGVM